MSGGNMKTIKWEAIRRKIDGLGSPYQPADAVVSLLLQGEKEPAPDVGLGYEEICSLRDFSATVFGPDRPVENILYSIEMELYPEKENYPEQPHPVWGETVMPGS